MKIALIGYGKMGHAIEQIAVSRGHEIVLKISSANKHELNEVHLAGADVAIEFTNPDAAEEHVLACLKAGVPVVCGTTGWNNRLDHAKMKTVDHNGAFLHASNFSIGVNIFFEINKKLAALMNAQDGYEVIIEETHHTEKKDAPSGTAISIAEQILESFKQKQHWVLNDTNTNDAIPVIAHRIDKTPGTHKVGYYSAIDDIEIIHTAHNREGFAKGAVLAAEFLAGRKGIFTMKDVLGIDQF